MGTTWMRAAPTWWPLRWPLLTRLLAHPAVAPRKLFPEWVAKYEERQQAKLRGSGGGHVGLAKHGAANAGHVQGAGAKGPPPTAHQVLPAQGASSSSSSSQRFTLVAFVLAMVALAAAPMIKQYIGT